MAEGLLNMVLGWMQWIYKWLWSMLASFGESEFMPWFSKNWLMIAIVLVLTGLVVDFTVYLVRWQPYFFWRLIAKDKRGGRPSSREEAARNRDRYAGYRRALGLDEDYNARFYNGNYSVEEDESPDEPDRYGGYRRGMPETDAYAAKAPAVNERFESKNYAPDYAQGDGGDYEHIQDNVPSAPVRKPVVDKLAHQLQSSNISVQRNANVIQVDASAQPDDGTATIDADTVSQTEPEYVPPDHGTVTVGAAVNPSESEYPPLDYVTAQPDGDAVGTARPPKPDKPRRVIRRPAKLGNCGQGDMSPVHDEDVPFVPPRITVKAIDEPEQVSIKLPGANAAASKPRSVWAPPEDYGGQSK